MKLVHEDLEKMFSIKEKEVKIDNWEQGILVKSNSATVGES